MSDAVDCVWLEDMNAVFVVGHMSATEMLRALLASNDRALLCQDLHELRDWCPACVGAPDPTDDCEECGGSWYRWSLRVAMLEWCRRVHQGYMHWREDPEYGEGWWEDCGADDEGAVPATIYLGGI